MYINEHKLNHEWVCLVECCNIMHYSYKVRSPSADCPDICNVNARTYEVMYETESQ